MINAVRNGRIFFLIIIFNIYNKNGMTSHIEEIIDVMKRIDESFRDYMLLMESQESKSISAAVNLVMKHDGCTKEEADNYVRNRVRNTFPALRNEKTAKFILGTTRLLLNDEFNDDSIKNKFEIALGYAASNEHINNFDRNLNGLSAQGVINCFAEQIQQDLENEKNDVNSTEYSKNNDYTIIKIDSYEQASAYNQYTDWCVTREPSYFNHYTDGGIGQFYFCLRNDFKEAKREMGENNPYDSYGLSMIAVCVDEDGRLKTCTSRWNSPDAPDGHLFTAKQLSELLGVNFYSTFEPNNNWKNEFDYAMRCLKNGEPVWKVFDESEEEGGYFYVKLNTKWNIYDENNKRFLSKKWFDNIQEFFDNGFAVVILNDKYNMLNEKGEIVFSDWFDYIAGIDDGCRRVVKNEHQNFIDKYCRFISNDWFEDADNFYDGLAYVGRRKTDDWRHCEYNYIRPDGSFLLNDWLDDAQSFQNGLAKVGMGDKENFVDTNGNFLIDCWPNRVWRFYKGKSIIKLNDKYNLVDRNGNVLLEQWYDGIGTCYDDCYLVVLNKKYNFIKRDTLTLVSPNQWYDDASPFNEGFASIKLKEKCNFIDTSGRILCPQTWFDDVIDDFDGGRAYAVIGDTRVKVITNGTIYVDGKIT